MRTIEQLLLKRKEINEQINKLSYDGYPEIRESEGTKYIYLRRRILGREEIKCASIYDKDLFESLIQKHKQYQELLKARRKIEVSLASLGFPIGELTPKVALNVDFALSNIKNIIYDQAILEGISTTFQQTEQIINNEKVSNMYPSDIQKIINLKHAWEFILSSDIILYPTDLNILCSINKIVEEGLIFQNGVIRSNLAVRISGTSYVPPLPTKEGIKEEINKILSSKETIEEKAVNLCLKTMKGQYFQDGNKRAAVIFANHFLISKGKGFMAVPSDKVPFFREVLIKYYENESDSSAKEFLLKECFQPLIIPNDKNKDFEM